MKKKLICAIALMAAITGGGMISAHAFLGPPDDFEGASAGRKMGHERHFTRMAEVLKLTDTQKEQVQSILKAEEKLVEPLREKLAENRKQLRQAAAAEAFEEGAVRTLAATQANLQTELILSRIKVRNQIHALLTPEQRELAGKLRPLLHERHGRRPPCPEPEDTEM